MDKVRCADCGYLAVRNSETRQVCEVELGMREAWHNPRRISIDASGRTYEDVPLCFMRAAALVEEVGSVAPAPVKVAEVIQAQRICGAFTPWQHGLTPKEHQDMQIAKDIAEANAVAQKDRDREQRNWQKEQAKEQRDWQEAQAKLNREWQDSWNRWNRIWQIALALVAGAIGSFFTAKFGMNNAPSPNQPNAARTQMEPAEIPKVEPKDASR